MTQCRRVTVIENVPHCVHGPMQRNGAKRWRCRHNYRPHHHAAQRKWSQSPGGLATTERYEEQPHRQLAKQLNRMIRPSFDYYR